MPESLVHTQSPLEFFKEQVEAACERQKVFPQPLTSYYVVSLLADFTHLERSAAAEAMISNEALGDSLRPRPAKRRHRSTRRPETGRRPLPLHLRVLFRQPAAEPRRRRLLRLARRVGLWVARRDRRRAVAHLLRSCPTNSSSFVDVLSEVSERTSLTSDSDLLRLYEKWLRTGSRRNGDLLAEQGIVPNESIVRSTKVIH